MTVQIPPPKQIHLAIPAIRLPIDIPFVGCTGGSATTYVGKQLGNLPDFATMLHIRTLLKALTEQIYALIQGELPDLLRPPVYAARAAQLITQVASIISTINDVISRVLAEVNAAITFANQKISEIQTLANQLTAIPENSLTLSQQLMLQRYQEYTGDLNAHIGRLQSTLGCLVGL